MGPRSRAGRNRSSPVFIAWRILVLLSLRASRCCAASSLRVRGVLARALAAASASLRVGVGRPLPPAFSDSGGRGVVSDLLRRNTDGLLGWAGGDVADSIRPHGRPDPSHLLAMGPRVKGLTRRAHAEGGPPRWVSGN